MYDGTGTGWYVMYKDEAEVYMDALEAENASLKAEVERLNCDLDGVAGHIGQMTKLVNRAEKAEAEREQALEVIREYRKQHTIGHFALYVCDTCKAADALLSLESEEGYCHAGKDGECTWSGCPQNRDREPRRSGRHCPLDLPKEEI